jgi:protein O-GlcNAc transferase
MGRCEGQGDDGLLVWTKDLSRADGLVSPGDPGAAARVHADLGLAHKRRGQLSEAIASYERALALDPSLAGVWVNLGRARREAGRLEAALSAFREALQRDPTPETYSMSSNALREAGRLAEALQAAHAALARNAWLGEAHLNEGAALHLSGQVAAASVSYFVASLLPDTRERALRNLSVALGGSLPEPQASDPGLSLVRALLAARESAPKLLALAELLQQGGRTPAAIVCLQRALTERPSAQGWLALARVLWAAGYRDEAEQSLLAASAVERGCVAVYRQFASWFGSAGPPPSARGLELLEQCPDDALALAKLGGIAQRLGLPARAERLYQRLVQLRPDKVESHLYLGTVLTEQGLHREALQAFERGVSLNPARWDVHSSLLFCLHLDPEIDPGLLFARHRAFGLQLERKLRSVASAAAAATIPAATLPAATLRASETGQRLRIGYVSPDLCGHPVRYFLEPVLRAHDPSQFEVRCYSDVKRPDEATAELSRWSELVPCRRWSHAELAARIRADQIDILVDLAGHTADNRLPMFALRPSPVQVSWLGYFDTTGLAAIDYRIADAHSVPEAAERRFVERVVRLPRSANCYLPPAAPPPAPPPCLTRGHVTFGCYNNPAKIGPGVCSAFARILHAVPGSQLCFKYRSFQDAELRRRCLQQFARDGIAGERVHFEGSSAVPEFLAAFSQIDVALDPFPYSGETTALHTLWMGVPLVTLEGPTLVQRLGSRVLRVAGLDGWVADSIERYIAIAVELARAPQALERWRSALRPQLAASALLDHTGVTRELEAAYRWMWQQHTAALCSTMAAVAAPAGSLA